MLITGEILALAIPNTVPPVPLETNVLIAFTYSKRTSSSSCSYV
jgi:hypothetical protein